jgi:hypothetical protein
MHSKCFRLTGTWTSMRFRFLKWNFSFAVFGNRSDHEFPDGRGPL